MQIIDFLATYWFLIGLSILIIDRRGKIENFLGKYEAGKWIMVPIMVPYVWYCIYKLATNDHFIATIQEAKKQKKIIDYF